MAEPLFCALSPEGIKQMRELGIAWPETYDGWYGLYRRRHTAGLEKAFLRVNGRILVDVQVFIQAVRQRTAV